MTQVFGEYIEITGQNLEYLQIGFSPSSMPLQLRWRNNGLSADFLADYLSTFFPGDDPETQERRTETRDATSFVANELLENAMKFNYAPGEHSVSVRMELDKDNIRFYAINCVDPSTIASFQTYIQRLLTEDPDDVYMEQMMNDAEDDEVGGSLGFLTMLIDYKAHLAWKFEYLEDDPTMPIVVVTTMVQLSV